eukprot:763194-Hanusia_phi.AAC.1
MSRGGGRGGGGLARERLLLSPAFIAAYRGRRRAGAKEGRDGGEGVGVRGVEEVGERGVKRGVQIGEKGVDGMEGGGGVG